MSRSTTSKTPWKHFSFPLSYHSKRSLKKLRQKRMKNKDYKSCYVVKKKKEEESRKHETGIFEVAADIIHLTHFWENFETAVIKLELCLNEILLLFWDALETVVAIKWESTVLYRTPSPKTSKIQSCLITWKNVGRSHSLTLFFLHFILVPWESRPMSRVISSIFFSRLRVRLI